MSDSCHDVVYRHKGLHPKKIKKGKNANMPQILTYIYFQISKTYSAHTNQKTLHEAKQNKSRWNKAQTGLKSNKNKKTKQNKRRKQNKTKDRKRKGKQRNLDAINHKLASNSNIACTQSSLCVTACFKSAICVSKSAFSSACARVCVCEC